MNRLDLSIREAARKRARAMSPAPAPSEIASALAEAKASAREIQEKAAEAERLGHANESLRTDIARFELRIARFKELGKGRIERPQSEYHQGLGILVEYEPLRSKLTGDQYADRTQTQLDELRAALDVNEQKIRELLPSS